MLVGLRWVGFHRCLDAIGALKGGFLPRDLYEKCTIFSIPRKSKLKRISMQSAHSLGLLNLEETHNGTSVIVRKFFAAHGMLHFFFLFYVI
jgi:hypothetical protein